MNRLTVAIGLTCALFASTLAADTITYLDEARVTKEIRDCTITSWSVSTVNYKTSADKSGNLKRIDVLNIDRNGSGSMCDELKQAISASRRSVDNSIPLFQAAIKNGSAVDKDEAMYLLAYTYEQSSATSKADLANAIAAYKAYTKSFKAGYFAEMAWQVLAQLQTTVSGRRSTLASMASADSALAYKGNLLLGQFECQQAKWGAAITALKKSKNAGGSSKGKKHLASAWLGTAMYKNKDASGAKSLLEPIVADKKFVEGAGSEHEMALAQAYPTLGDIYFDAKNYAKAYATFMQGGFYCWWSGDKQLEGRSLGQAYLCTKKLKASGKKWEKLHNSLSTALQQGFPRVKSKIDKLK